MDKEKLMIANKLNANIEELKHILQCFEWDPNDDLGSDKAHPTTISRNPEIIIEYDADDGNGRETIKLPKTHSESWIPHIERNIRINIEVSKKEFNAL